jgi:Gnt-I system low-affinity gluconate transporter
MSAPSIVFIVILGVSALLFLVLKFRLNAFIALLLTSILVGILTGMPLSGITQSIQEGMGNTLGFIATVVGLGAIFGQMLESSGGARSLARYLLGRFGDRRATWALALTGYIIGIPIFLDVGFIILIPVVYAIARNAKKSLLFYAIPLLAGLAVTHTMVPPTPGPTAVAQILGVDLGWVVLFGLIIGLPVTIIAGPVFGRYIAGKIDVQAPRELEDAHAGQAGKDEDLPRFGIIALIISVPLVLILASTFVKFGIEKKIVVASLFTDILVFIGHPFCALIIATLLSILLCLKRKFSKEAILELSTKALGPAGIIILVTGAGGVLKQILVDSGIGKTLAESIAGSSIPVIVLAWVLTAVVRVTQGSATVAMITAASLIAPVVQSLAISQPEAALVVMAIASGATILSHVNDSGFWIVGKYLGMNEKQTLRSWTVMETIIAVSGLLFTLLASVFV